MITIITFDEAIKKSACYKKRHLLLGNGFSIACRPNTFNYGSLFEKANFSSAPKLPDVFKAIGTKDFEHIIKILMDASRVVTFYSKEAAETAKQMTEDAEALKIILINTVGKNHPKKPNEITNKQFLACRRFLAHFIGKTNEKGKVYTLNYDLLLYWVLMHDDMESGNKISLKTNDGFGRDEDTEPEYVDWMGESTAHNQGIHYLHGALHLFDADTKLQKYTWTNTHKPLLEQVQEAMAENKFPLFVAEGESKQKLAKIKHNAYLYHSYKSFSKQMESKNDTLFIFGHSLADSDQHVLEKIECGKIAQVYIGLYGNPKSEGNKKIQGAATKLAQARNDKYPLEVSYFDANSAQVWGD